MEKQDYIKMRNNGNYDLKWFYKYYLNNGGKQIDLNTFNMLFRLGDLSSILEYLDVKFKLTRLYDKDNNFLKIVE